jgi:excisionase family DNA binding protein
MEEKLLSVMELAEKLGNVARSTIYEWMQSGKIPSPVHIGRRIFWRLSEINEWIKAGCPGRGKWEQMNASA